MPRHFTRATSERIAYTLGSMTTFPWGTAAAYFRVDINFTGGSFASIFSTDAASDDALAFFLDGDNGARFATYNGTGGAVNGAAGMPIVIADSWVLCAWTKGTGTVAPTFHTYYSLTGTWVHAAGATSPDPALTLTGIKVGANHTNADAFEGDMAALMLIPNYVMSNAEIERLPRGRWSMYGPGWLREFPPKDSVALLDPRGGDSGKGRATESSLTLTTPGAVAGPPGFRYSRFARRR